MNGQTLTPAKSNVDFAALRQLMQSPAYSYAPEKYRRIFSTIQAMYPEQFKAAKPVTIQPKLTSMEMAQKQARSKAAQLTALDITTPEWYGEAERKGYYPEVKEKGIPGKVWDVAKYPLNAILQLLNIVPRFSAGLVTGGFKKAITAAVEPLVKPESEYAKYGWAEGLKELFPGAPITKEFELTKEWEKSPSVIKRILSGLGGSPADIVGLAMDILLDPITYLTGGLGRGAAQGLRLTKPLVAKGAKVVLPKGAMLGLTKLGRATLKPKVISKVDDIIEAISTMGAKEAELILPKGMTASATKSYFTRKVLEDTLIETVKNLPYEQAVKLVDFGGLKFMGKTIVPGYKFARFTKPIIAGAERNPIIAALEKHFWTGAGIPEELRPIKHLIEAEMRYRGTEGRELLFKIFKGLSDAEVEDIGKYLWMSSDVARLQAKGKSVPAKLISQLDEITKKLNPKQLQVAKRYEKEFTKEFLFDFEKALDIEYPELARYYPPRYKAEPSGFKRAAIGAKVAPFQMEKQLSFLQAQKLIKAGEKTPKTFVEASLKRLLESTQKSGRAKLLQEVKQFGSPFKKAGFIDAGRYLPELKGWHLPEEIIKPLTRMENMFFGDEAVKYSMNLLEKGTNIWKKTALFTPGYHLRNFYTDLQSGMLEWGLDFLNPRYWDEAIKIKLGNHVPIKSLGGMYADDASKMMLKTGEMQAGLYAVEAGRVGGKWGGFMKDIDWTLPAWKGRTPFAISRKLGGAREDMGRIVGSLIEREAGASTVTAAEAVARVFFNYANITPFERKFMRGAAIPFYCVDTETEALSKSGWKKYNEIKEDELLFTVNLKTKEIELQKNKGIAVFDYEGELIQLKNRNVDILMTPNHRCIFHKWNRLSWKIKEAQDLSSNDWLPIATNGWNENKKKIYLDDFVRLIGWVICEGSIYDNYVCITQSPKNHSVEIENILNNLKYKWIKKTKKNVFDFHIQTKSMGDIINIVNKEKDLPLNFILSLTREQMLILYETMIKGDGYHNWKDTGFSQKNNITANNFQILCTLIGKNTKLTKRTKFYGNRFSNSPINIIRVKRIKNICPKYANKKYIKYKGKVWCPSTPNGTVIFRRNGIVFPSGQTWTRKNLARQVELLLTRTGAYAAIPKAIHFVENMSKVPEGYEQFKSSYVKSLGGIITPLRDPRTLEPLILNPNFAWQEWERLNPENLFQALSPAIKIPFELAGGREFFSKRQIYTGDPVKAPQPLNWMKRLPVSVLSQIGMKKSVDSKELYMSPLAMYVYNQNPIFYNIGRMLPAEPDEKTRYATMSIALGLKFWLYEEDKQKERHFRNFKNEADKILREKRTLGFALPDINDIVKAYKFAYEQELRGKYGMEEVEQWEENMAMMSTMGMGMPSMIRQPIEQMYQEKYKEPFRAEYKEAVGLPFGELYPLMQQKGVELAPQDIQSILDTIGQTTQLE